MREAVAGGRDELFSHLGGGGPGLTVFIFFFFSQLSNTRCNDKSVVA
jgi:hypothetical protein